MYEITDDSLAIFKSKILNLQDNRSYCFNDKPRYPYSNVNCIGSGHKTNSFRIDGDGVVDLVYKNKINFVTFKIAVRFARLTYDICLEKSNINYNYNDKNIIVRKDIHVVGVTVGDLLKHFYHNNKDIPSKEDEYENDKMIKLIKKSLSVDTTNAKITDVLGKIRFTRKTIRLWENLAEEKFIDRGESNFVGFCNKIIILSEGMFYKLFVKNNVFIPCDKYYYNIFNNLSNKTIVVKLLRYHLYNKDPEDGLNNCETIYFDSPTPVPEILEYFYKKYNDERYMEAYRKVMKTLNSGQMQDMAKRYGSPTTFKSIQKINDEYPMYAFRNISLEQWKNDDLFDLEWHDSEYMRSKKYQKIKYKMQKSDKVIPVEFRFGCSYWRTWKDWNWDENKKFKRKYMKGMIKEGLDDFEKNSDNIVY